MERIIGRRVGARIRDLRVRAGLSQSTLAERLVPPVEPETISRWERGTRLPALDRLQDVAGALGTDLDGFLAGMLRTPEPTADSRRATREIDEIGKMLAPLSPRHLESIRAMIAAHLAAVKAAQDS